MFAQDRRLATVFVATCLGAMLASGASAQPLPPSFDTYLLSAWATALDQAGGAAQRQGDYREAIPLYARAAELWQALAARRAAARSLVEQGWSHVFVGEAATGMPLLEESRRLAHESGDTGLEAEARVSIGLAHRAEGELDLALAAFAAALPLAERAPRPALAAEIHANVGNALADVGELEKALAEYQRAADDYRAIDEKRGLGQALSYIGAIHAQLGEHEKALAAYAPALAALRSIAHSYQAVVLHRMGTAHRMLGQFARAEQDYQAALPVWRAHNLQWGEAMTLAELGALATAQKQYQRAIDLLGTALPMSREQNDRPRVAAALEMLAEARLALGETEPARDGFRQATDLFRTQGNPRRQAGALAGWARAERASGQLVAARAHVEEALALLERLRRNFFSDDLRAAYLASVRKYYELYLDLLLDLGASDPTAAAAALTVSEESRARVLLDLLARAGIDLGADLVPELHARRDANAAAVAAAQSALLALRARGRADAPRGAELEQELERLEAARDRLEVEIRRASPAYADIVLPTPLAAREVQALLPADTALLEYFLGAEHSYLVVATPAAVRAMRLPPEREIAADVAELRAGLEQPGRRGLASLFAAARRLHRTLIEPAAELLDGYRRWIVAPDGALYQLPFEALITRPLTADLDRPPTFLVRERVVSYVPSASVLARLAARPASPPGAGDVALLAFGDPDYGPSEAAGASALAGVAGELVRGAERQQRGWTFRRLPATGREVSAIARLFPPGSARVYLRADAREASVKREVAATRSRYWHFAAHALVDEKRPRDSGLVLALGQDPAEDGLLQVHEIFDLHLPCELVVLSACETATGREVRGEGILGLTRAFFHAGARGLVASLWQVEDRSTADLMTGFYDRLRAGLDPAVALQQQKLELLDGGRFSHPFYWAPFVLSGAATTPREVAAGAVSRDAGPGIDSAPAGSRRGPAAGSPARTARRRAARPAG